MGTGADRARFPSTRWSLVRRAGTPDGAEAREELCRGTWYPLYAYLRRSGHGPEEAHDLVQGFFARFLERNDLAGLDGSGRFRSYLLAALRHHVVNECERSRTLKRGGGAPLSLDLVVDRTDAEERYAREPADGSTPETLYARKWALAVLERVLARLRQEQLDAGRGEALARLQPFLVADEGGETLSQAAAELGLSPGTARVAIHRLRKRYRELLLAEVCQTVDRPQDVEAELRELFEALGAS